MLTLLTPIKSIRGVGAVLAEKFSSLGLETLQDALFYFPFRHEDFRHQTTIDQIQAGMDVTLHVTVTAVRTRRVWRRHMAMTEVKVTDESGAILPVVWFNLPFISEAIKQGDRLFLSGRITARQDRLQMHNPTFERPTDHPSHATLVPVYRTTGGLSQRQLRKIVRLGVDLAEMVPDPLPHDLIEQHHLLDRAAALRGMHFPANPEEAKQSVDRFKFEELLAWQIQWRQLRHSYADRQAPELRFDEQRIRKFVQALPFELTDSQRIAAWQIIQDTAHPRPMYRLLQGDVGSGKTVVAAIAGFNAALNKHQVAFLAPTVILAEQHYQTLSSMFHGLGLTIALLTGTGVQSTAPEFEQPERFLAGLRLGEIHFVIGTHALLEEHVLFHQLGLVIVDEQQRFGVRQRQALLEARKDIAPHLLSLTATPIPRTLALSLTGQLSITVMKGKPKGRSAIATDVIGPDQRDRIAAAIQGALARHEQVYIITPRIEEDDALGSRAVTVEFDRIREQFSHARVGIAHGSMKATDRVEVMKKFRDNDLDILVATTVIEVGVDVPNATLMIIENADRFGLAQLHQLRGRVGRGTKASHCLLVTDQEQDSTRQRLQHVAELDDGFALAELDLAERGAGELYGVRQSGLPDWRLATLQDIALMDTAAQAAEMLMNNDPVRAMEIGKNLATTDGATIHRE